MSSPSIPAPPAAPDYATSNKTAIDTDISTLPLRNQINQAAQLGQKVTYTDPVTGVEKTADFTGQGNAVAAQQAAQIAADSNAAMQKQQLALRQQLGVPNVQQTIAELQAADPKGYNLRQDLTSVVGNRLTGEGAGNYTSQDVADTAGRIRSLATNAPGADTRRLGTLYNQAGQTDGRLGNIYDQATRLPTSYSDATSAAMQPALKSALDDYALGGKLNDAELREVTNNARAGQVARGNYLGDAAAVQEGLAQLSASESKKQQRLQNLLNIQGQVFGQNDALRNESQNAATSRLGMLSGLQGQDFGQGQQRIGQQAGLIGQQFGQGQQAYTTGLNAAQAALAGSQAQAQDQRANRQENFGYDQQRIANAQAVGLGSPITNQFGSLGGAQQGAVGFTPVNYTPVGQTNANAGAQGTSFAQGLYGTQAQIWNKQADIASQGNPWMSLLGNAAGAAGSAAMMAMI